VHISPVDEGADDRCQSTGGHWNPYGVSLENCSPDEEDWYYCEVGDLSGKHAPLNVPSTKGGKVLLTDTNLPLSGAWSIADRSIVIHAENGGSPRDDCATLVKQGQPRVVTANFDMHGVTGYVRFTQESPDAFVLIEVNLDGLEDGPNPWHIHEFPVADSCESDSTGGHFNPTGWDGYPVCEGENCEAGDLSGRHGALTGDGILALYEDSNITLFGPDSFAGRSIVIHKSDGSRWACATIGYSADVKVVKATFEGEVQGTITLTQAVDEPSSETTVLVQLKYSDPAAAATAEHMYHVHQFPIDLDAEDRCGSAGGHWYDMLVCSQHARKTPTDLNACLAAHTGTRLPSAARSARLRLKTGRRAR
jgi:Cu/Zn superoxide dismutase